jgi:predicted type IV restriction endonuclease
MMATTLAISKYVNSLQEIETKFSAQQNDDNEFFTEWYEDLPELNNLEKERCDRIKERYLYHRHRGHIGEGIVNQIVITPLLEMAKLYDPPFDIESEYPVQIEEIEMEEDEEVIYKGKIDTLVIQDSLWVLVIETKGKSFSIEAGMAQALTYMLVSPNQSRPTYGLVSNGGFSIFVKAVQNKIIKYQFSNDFSLYNRKDNELFDILRILKKISQLFLSNL